MVISRGKSRQMRARVISVLIANNFGGYFPYIAEDVINHFNKNKR